MDNELGLFATAILWIFVIWVGGLMLLIISKRLAKHWLFISHSVGFSFLLTPLLFFEYKTIPFQVELICDKTYEKTTTTDLSTYALNDKGKVEIDFNEQTDSFSAFVDKNIFDNSLLGNVHWAYGFYAVCIKEVEEKIKESSQTEFFKTGRFPRWCQEYSECRGSPFSYLKEKPPLNLDANIEDTSAVTQSSYSFLILSLIFYISFIVLWRKLMKSMWP